MENPELRDMPEDTDFIGMTVKCKVTGKVGEIIDDLGDDTFKVLFANGSTSVCDMEDLVWHDIYSNSSESRGIGAIPTFESFSNNRYTSNINEAKMLGSKQEILDWIDEYLGIDDMDDQYHLNPVPKEFISINDKLEVTITTTRASSHRRISTHYNKKLPGGIFPFKFVGFDYGVLALSDCGLKLLTNLPSCDSLLVSRNELVTLNGCPKNLQVLSCDNNKLKSLAGCPSELEHFDCSNNELVDLVGGPSNVKYKYDCSKNRLTSLRGAPQSVGNFDCSNNLITNIDDLNVDMTVKYTFDATGNLKTDLDRVKAKTIKT